MGKRTCGCGERGRHKPTCQLRLVKTASEIVSDNLTLKNLNKPYVDIMRVKDDAALIHQLYLRAYGKPPELAWSFNKKRQLIMEKRIRRCINKKRAFYLTLTKSDNTVERLYIDGGNWASNLQFDGSHKLVGHIRNMLPFIEEGIIFWELVGRARKK